jgi:hypothetical protein
MELTHRGLQVTSDPLCFRCRWPDMSLIQAVQQLVWDTKHPGEASKPGVPSSLKLRVKPVLAGETCILS